jgi:hypothetical protein
MIDYDRDGELTSLDLLSAFEQISDKCKFGKELHLLMQWFTDKNVKERPKNKKDWKPTGIAKPQYLALMPWVGLSCAVREITKKVLAPPLTFKNE